MLASTVSLEELAEGEDVELAVARFFLGRLRLTVLADGATFDVFVDEACFDAVTLGDPWPPDTTKCG